MNVQFTHVNSDSEADLGESRDRIYSLHKYYLQGEAGVVQPANMSVRAERDENFGMSKNDFAERDEPKKWSKKLIRERSERKIELKSTCGLSFWVKNQLASGASRKFCEKWTCGLFFGPQNRFAGGTSFSHKKRSERSYLRGDLDPPPPDKIEIEHMIT